MISAWEIGTLLGAVLLGGGLAFLWTKYQRLRISLILSLAAGYLMGIIATHLLPDIFGQGSGTRSGLFLLVGFLIQLLLDHLSQGVEHGHIHTHRDLGRQFYTILIGLSLHAILEGLPLTGYEVLETHAHQHTPGYNHLLAGIALHKIPAAYVLALLMRINGFSRRRFWMMLILFSLMTPLGAWLGGHFVTGIAALQAVMALVVGSLLHIATTILFESEGGHHHHLTWWKLLAVVIGIGLALIAH